ncbi:MAG: hypothetical protein ABI624_02695 [Casimicrobiaceae bacterium]
MLPPRLPLATVALIAIVLAGGLAVDVRTDFVGQAVLGIGVWAVLLLLLNRMARDLRYALMTCLVIATLGEVFLTSWGLYAYRLDNVPLFVPPGHVLLLLLGLWLAQRLPASAARVILAGAGIYSVAVAAAGLDTLGLGLLAVIAVAAYALPSQQRLYASTFVLALALELYGTWLGSWTWAPRVPHLDLVTTNPPGAAGAFYCALDALVAVATVQLLPRIRAWTGRTKSGALAA